MTEQYLETNSIIQESAPPVPVSLVASVVRPSSVEIPKTLMQPGTLPRQWIGGGLAPFAATERPLLNLVPNRENRAVAFGSAAAKLSFGSQDANVNGTTPDRRHGRKKSMSRRSGQQGHIERKGDAFYVRFWLDVPGQDKRVHKSIRICPVKGPGQLTKPERQRRAREIITESGADSEAHFAEIQGVNLGTTFREQAECWFEQVTKRKRRPVKPATAQSWRYALKKWLNPNLGEMPLADVNNFAVKGLISKMAESGLSAKTISTYFQVVKMVVASAVTEEGEQRYPRNWNHDFIDLPEIGVQRKPALSTKEVSPLVAAAGEPYRTLYALLAGSGLRIGEALGLRIEQISADRRTISVQQSVWNGQVQRPKTVNAVRSVDIDPALAGMLNRFIGDRKTGFLFATKSGRPMGMNNILNRHLNPLLERLQFGRRGFHAFRRFRTTWLRKNRVPEDLIRFWLGHANRSVTDGYSMLRDDVAFRLDCAEKVGPGFDLAEQSRNGLKSEEEWHENCSFVPSCTQESVSESCSSSLIQKDLGL